MISPARPHPAPPRRPVRPIVLFLAVAAGLLACERRGGCEGDYCGTVVFAATGEPDVLLPPVTQFATARDVTDQMFLKLADLGLSLNTIGDEDFQPLLAARWEWQDPLTPVFPLDPRARSQDGRPVTAGDVVVTFDAYTHSLLHSPLRSTLRRISAVTARDS